MPEQAHPVYKPGKSSTHADPDEELAMATNDGATAPGPPPVLFALLDAARGLPPDQRAGPFRGVGSSDAFGNDGLAVGIGPSEVFLSDEDAGALIAGDYIDISVVGAGDAIVHILERGVDADRNR